jgi:RND family efflux transporter MFP subunit
MNLPCSRPLALAAACGGLLLVSATGCAEKSAAAPVARAPRVAYAKGKIDLEGGLVRLAASRDGIIKNVCVEEGAQVTRGQLLAEIDDQAARLAHATVTAELAEARRALEPLRVRLAAAEKDARRIDPLHQGGALPDADRDHAHDAVAALRADLALAETRVATTECRLRAAAYEIEQHKVRAPLDGTIVKRQARLGDGVSTLNVTPLFVFSPDGPRIARADLDERYVGLISPGMPVTVIAEADETRSVPGVVRRVGQVFGPRQFDPDPGERVDTRVIECVVSIEDRTLLIGQRVLVKAVQP